MAKILKTVNVRANIRVKEILRADQDSDMEDQSEQAQEVQGEESALPDRKLSGNSDALPAAPRRPAKKPEAKAPHMLDPFFAEAADAGAKVAKNPEAAEKRVVNRDGYVPKLQKNIIKEQRYQQDRQHKKDNYVPKY